MTETTNNPQATPGLEDLILERWARPHTVSSADRPIEFTADRTTDMLASLPVQRSMSGRFGAEAFELSSFIATESRFAFALSPELRAMNLGEISELVQLVLEEEEAALEELYAEYGATQRQRGKRGAAQKRAAEATQAKKRALTKKKAARAGDARRIQAVRRAIEKVRQHAAKLRAGLVTTGNQAASPNVAAPAELALEGGVDTSPTSGVGSVLPNQAEPVGSIREVMAVLRAERLQSGLSSAARGSSPLGQSPRLDTSVSPLDMVSSVSVDRTASRALRVAEWTADMAMLAPGVEAPVQPSAEAVSDWTAASAAVAESTRGVSLFARPETSAATSLQGPTVAELSAQTSPVLSVPQLIRAAEQAQRLASAPRAQPAATTRYAGMLPKVAKVQAMTRGAQGVPGTVTRAAARPSVVTGGGFTDTGVEAAGVLGDSTAPVNTLTPGLSGAVDVTARALRGAERWRTALPQQPAPAIYRASVSQGLTGAVERWLERTDIMLSPRASTASDALTDAATSPFGFRPVRTRELEAVGAGEALRLTEEGLYIPATDDVTPGVAQPAARTRSLFDTRPVSTASASPTQRLTNQPAALSASESASTPAWLHAAAPEASVVPGGVAVSAFALHQQVLDRLSPTAEPVSVAPSWRPSTAQMTTVTSATEWLDEVTLPAPGSRAELEAISGITGIPVESLRRMNSGAIASMRGALADQAGPGEWLLPGDSGFDDFNAEQRTGPGVTRPSTRPPARAAVERLVSAKSQQPEVRELGHSRPLTRAADAAIAQVVERASRVQQMSATMSSEVTGRSAMDFAMSPATWQTRDAMGLVPQGQADVVTPWLLSQLAEQGGDIGMGALRIRDLAGAGAVSPTLLTVTELSDEQPAMADVAAAPSAGPAEQAVVTPRIQSAEKSDPLQRLTHSERRVLARALGESSATTSTLMSALAQPQAPAALKAALSLYGESSADLSTADQAFVARFFGFKPVESKQSLQTASMTQLSPMTTLTTSEAVSEGATSPAQTGDEMVFKGMAGLAALREMSSAGVEATTLVELSEPQVAETVSPAVGEAPVTVESTLAQRSGGRGALPQPKQASTAVKTHRFAPASLRRSRRLLSGRRSAALRATPRGIGARRSAGYGDSALGGGALLGLVQGDGAGPGEIFGSTAATRRADQLGAAIQARRAPRPGQVLRPMPAGDGAMETVRRGGGQSPSMTPYAASAAAGFDDAALVSPSTSPASAMEAAAIGNSPVRNTQAGAMARVLSVTAAPSANVLPLVAPAARAVVAQAAAKPMSESIATSGATATSALPMTGHDVSGGGEASGGGGGDSAQAASGDSQQNMNQLAMKIARSVMVRIKRERERRGIHG